MKNMTKFSKTNTTQFTDALFKEADGLAHLQEVIHLAAIEIKIPVVFKVDEHKLVLEKINPISGSKNQWLSFGKSLAKLHKQPQAEYGWHQDNYIGLNPQRNELIDDWGSFFFKHRLTSQVQMILDTTVKKQFSQSLEAGKTQLIKFLNKNCNHPSLLHGDLWNGNVLFDEQHAWLIDPAIYFGDAEADLAMTEMFGGFPATFYQGYQSIQPLSKQYLLKKVIYNLYHQLNHYNLFGSGYLAGCERGFKMIAQGLAS